jgi:phosphohistidine phosphatase
VLECAATTATDERIYAAPAESLLHLVTRFPRDAAVAAIVGHNPGCEDLAGMLAGQGDADSAAEMARKFPTSGVAVIEFPGEWADLAPGAGWLTAFAAPRG